MLTDAVLSLTDETGKVYTANEDGTYTLGYGTYTYALYKDGYVRTFGSFTLGSADAADVVDGTLAVDTDKLPTAGENGWDGAAAAEPKKDEDDTYLIGTAAELVWFAQKVNSGDTSVNAKLTADIELSGFDWTPIGTKSYYGTFDGDGHVICNLYINKTSYPLGLFGYLSSGAVVKNLGVTGNVTCTNANYAQAGGIAGYMNSGSTISQSFSAVNVTSKKYAGSIAGYTNAGANITDCYATGNIATTSANECYLGGICGSNSGYTNGATLTNCYATGTVTGTKGNASYIGGLSPSNNEANYVNSYYLDGTLSGESAKYGVTGKGTAKTADELKALTETLGEAFTADTANINGGCPILTWQAGETPEAKLDHIEITAVPKKTEYIGGEDFEADGMVVTAYYTDSTTKVLESGEYEIVNGASLKASTDKVSVTIKVGDKSAAVEVSVFALGDVNMDGIVNHKDAALVYSYFNGTLKEDKMFNAYQLRLADVDANGNVNHKDAARIYAFFNGTLDKLPAAK